MSLPFLFLALPLSDLALPIFISALTFLRLARARNPFACGQKLFRQLANTLRNFQKRFLTENSFLQLWHSPSSPLRLKLSFGDTPCKDPVRTCVMSSLAVRFCRFWSRIRPLPQSVLPGEGGAAVGGAPHGRCSSGVTGLLFRSDGVTLR